MSLELVNSSLVRRAHLAYSARRPVMGSGTNQVRPKTSGEVSEWLKEHAWKVCIR